MAKVEFPRGRVSLRETTRADLSFVMATEAEAKRGGFVGGDAEETHRRRRTNSILATPTRGRFRGRMNARSVTPSCAVSQTPTAVWNSSASPSPRRAGATGARPCASSRRLPLKRLARTGYGWTCTRTTRERNTSTSPRVSSSRGRCANVSFWETRTRRSR